MSLFRAIYTSRSAGSLSFAAVADIMSRAESNNRRDGVTGMLAYGDGRFLQVIEGEREALNRLLVRLYRDRRHDEIGLIEWVETSERRFERWAMKCCDIDLTRERVNPLLRKYSGTSQFDPTLMNAGQCLGLLMVLSES